MTEATVSAQETSNNTFLQLEPPRDYKTGNFGIAEPPVEMVQSRHSSLQDMQLPPLRDSDLDSLPMVRDSKHSIAGSSADVYFAEMTRENNKYPVALKVFKDPLQSEFMEPDGRFPFELELLRGKFLAHEGIGPRIHGWTTVGEGDETRAALVMDAVSGYDVLDQKLPRGVVKKQTFEDLTRIKETISAEDRVMPDFQVKITPTGRLMVIDFRNPFPLSRLGDDKNRNMLRMDFEKRIDSIRKQLKKSQNVLSRLRK